MENRFEAIYSRLKKRSIFFLFAFWCVPIVIFLLLFELFSYFTLFIVNRELLLNLKNRNLTHREIYLAQESPLSEFDFYKELLKETEESYEWKYLPYVSWRNKEYKGIYVNISEDGTRRTINKFEEDENTKKIFCFGGSSTFGYLNADSQTWPSQLSIILNKKKERYTVINYGENGYTFDQNIHQLIDILKKGKIPEYVFFYIGHNESGIWLYPNYIPGNHGGISEYQQAVNIIKSKPIIPPISNVIYGVDRFLTKYSLNYSLLIHFYQRTRKNNSKQILHQNILDENLNKVISIELSEETNKAYAKISAKYFLNYVRMLNALAAEYKIKIYIGLQPNIYTTGKIFSSWEKSKDRSGIFSFDQIRYDLKTDDILYDTIRYDTIRIA